MKKVDVRKNIFTTLSVILSIAVVALGILYLSGALNTESTRMKYTADSVCFLSGYPDGVDMFKYENGTYSFNCSEVTTGIYFDANKASGEITVITEENKDTWYLKYRQERVIEPVEPVQEVPLQEVKIE